MERKNELYKNLPESFSKYDEDNAQSTVHLALYLNNSIVSGLTLIKKKINGSDPLSFQIRGMFTKKAYINKGYGSTLIQYAKDEVMKSNGVIFWCNSRKKAINFYKKNGFIENSNFFKIERIGLHKKLTLEVKK
ncbi:MAG: GNAT family N-acetyltransferase [Alphaproteobacteria bacterium]